MGIGGRGRGRPVLLSITVAAVRCARSRCCSLSVPVRVRGSADTACPPIILLRHPPAPLHAVHMSMEGCDTLGHSVQHLQQSIAGRALDVLIRAAQGQVEHGANCGHQAVPVGHEVLGCGEGEERPDDGQLQGGGTGGAVGVADARLLLPTLDDQPNNTRYHVCLVLDQPITFARGAALALQPGVSYQLVQAPQGNVHHL
mmetsp:Transcript_21661/g.60099  ORF Transcript_21661/g.60099 Transcript_21661/m.60099 type:complete len:200 (+) Transcript_21661:807-1406(+)